MIFPGITPDDFDKRPSKVFIQGKGWTIIKTALKPELISSEDCQKLILKNIDIEEPNYYQIMSFINVLAVQLKRLSANYILNAYQFMENNKEDLCIMRTFIVKSFIALTSHFTKGAYTDLLQGQDDLSRTEFGIYTEQKDLDKAIGNLAGEIQDVVSFDKINPSLVFFHEKYSQLFSIITNKLPKDDEYKQLLKLINCQILEDYQNEKKKQKK